MVVIFIHMLTAKSIDFIFHRDKEMSFLTVFFPTTGLVDKMVVNGPTQLSWQMSCSSWTIRTSYTNMLIVFSSLKYHLCFLFSFAFSMRWVILQNWHFLIVNFVTEIKINGSSRLRFLAKLQYSTMLLSNFHCSSAVLGISKTVEFGQNSVFI